ncbi:MAG TPA: phosphatidylglycerol lysyltransferase domain-containing protein [Candidatus Saccharimonadales bacterium]|nr:phosphatidylglycerol lysyltransferase domain-containing protein [Candidatus Saccharimonadales bacterium]
MNRSLFTRSGKRNAIASLIATIIALHGVLIVAAPLVYISVSSRDVHFHPVRLIFDVQLLFAVTLLYLSTLLRRRKQRAWTVTMVVYGLLIVTAVLRAALVHRQAWGSMIETLARGDIAIPVLVVVGLWLSRNQFTVKSDTRSFMVSLQVAALALGVTFLYGVTGFMILGQHSREFHHHITLAEAAHRTVDQLNITTSTNLEPRSRRADVFVDSLTFLSVTAVAYCFISLFQPVRSRLSHQKADRRLAQALIDDFPVDSESFFKLWPRDKQYFFNDTQTAGVAYGVRRSVAVVVGDPFGDPAEFPMLLDRFEAFCRDNDWAPAFVHTTLANADLFRDHGYALQKLGEEAVVDVPKFYEHVRQTKYFRQIKSRFEKRGYTVEVSQLPHSKETLQRVAAISEQWLARPGRDERRFMLGYFNAVYMQQCPLLLLRDADGIVQAFLNQLPVIDPQEANFDLLRGGAEAPSNSNDFLLLAFIDMLHEQGVQKLNLGLCPLAGLTEQPHNKQNVLITSALKFVFANGDRFYSFRGLYKFKAKYEPEWRPRYVAYKGGVAGFTKTMTALNKLMSL